MVAPASRMSTGAPRGAIVRTVYATEPHKIRPDEIARRAFEIAAAMERERQRRVHQGA